MEQVKRPSIKIIPIILKKPKNETKTQNYSQNFDDIKEKDKKYNDLKYKLLVKRIAMQLRKRVKLPKCKIFKFYQKYRELILRIANGLKKTAKNLIFWEKKENNIMENIKENEDVFGEDEII